MIELLSTELLKLSQRTYRSHIKLDPSIQKKTLHSVTGWYGKQGIYSPMNRLKIKAAHRT